MVVASCQNRTEQLLSEIQEIEKSEKRGTPEGLKELAALHAEYGLDNHDSISNEYLYSAGMYYFMENDYDQAETLFFEYISRDDSTERFKMATLFLAKVLASEKRYSEADELISEVLEQHLPNYQQWHEIIALYDNKVKEDPKPADYERLALAYTAVGRFDIALKKLDTSIENYPDNENRSDLIYRGGFIAWEYLKDEEQAARYYNKFLQEYPNDPKAGEVKNILSSGMLSMSDEEVLEMLKGNAQ